MEKEQVFYIHCGNTYTDYDNFLYDLKHKKLWNASDEPVIDKWSATLRRELGEEYQVFMPSMPNKQNAKYEEWKIWFERHFEFIKDGVVLLGWSQGGYFFAKYISENTLPIKAKSLILVAAPAGPDNFGGEDGGDFAFLDKNLNNISKQVDKIYILHSKDDFVVPYEHALKYKEALPEAELITFEDKNHFLVEELPELVELIKGLE